MNIKQYRDKHGRPALNKLAKELGHNSEYFYQLATGIRKPSLRVAIKIEEATAGEILREDMLPEIFKGFSRNV